MEIEITGKAQKRILEILKEKNEKEYIKAVIIALKEDIPGITIKKAFVKKDYNDEKFYIDCLGEWIEIPGNKLYEFDGIYETLKSGINRKEKLNLKNEQK